MAKEVYINQAGTVKKALTIHLNQAGTVKEVKEGWINEAGTVKQFYANTPPAGPPNAPTNFRVTGSTSNSLNLAWTASTINGNAVTGYRVEFGTDGVNFPSGNNYGAATTTASIGSLANATTYYFRIKATSAAGDSPYAFTNGQTQVATAPQVPSVSPVGSGSTSNAQWQAFAGGGGTPDFYDYDLAAYPFTSFTAGSGTVAFAGNPTNISISGLDSAKAYTISIRARNGVGSSAYTTGRAVQVVSGSRVDFGSLSAQTNTDDTGAFKDIGYANNLASEGGSGSIFGSVSPGSMNGTILKFSRTGSNTFAISQQSGTPLAQNAFTRLTVLAGNFSFTLEAADATFAPGLGLTGTIYDWSWGGIPTEFIGEIVSGTFKNWKAA
jgi:hypothetical protein